MKKYAVLCACGLAAAMMFSGCGKKADTTQTTEAAETTAADQSQADGQTEAGSEGETTGEGEASEEVEITGEVELGKYKGVEVTKQDTEVTDEELQNSIDTRLQMNAEMVEVDRAAAEGDTVNIDYVGMKDGEAFEGGTAEGFDLKLGSGRFIDGFEDGLIGAVKGQELSLNLSFPEEYPNSPDLAGQPVVFDVTVNAVKEEKLPELNEEFVKKNSDGKFTDIEEWKEDIKAQLKEQKEAQAKTLRQSEILQAVVEGSTFTGIEDSVKAQYERQISQAENMAAIYGMKFSDMAAMYQMDEQTYKDFLYTQVENSVKAQLVLKKVAEVEKLEVTDADRQAVAEENQADSVAQLLEMLGEGAEHLVDEYALNKKAMELMESSAVEKQ